MAADKKRRDALSFDLRRRKQYEDGVIVRVRSRTKYDVLIPGRAHPYEAIPPLEPVYLRVGDVVKLGFIEDNPGIPVILCRGGVQSKRFFLGAETLSLSWPTFRQSYGRASRINGSITGSWSSTPDLYPTAIRLTEDVRWERRGADGLWSMEEPWQLYRDGVAVGSSSLLMWHDLSVVDGVAIGLVAEEDGKKWFGDPDYPLPNEENSLTNGTWTTALPDYEEDDDGGGGDDGGGDDGGGVVLG
ncbi:MAG: hypothetical protein WC314_19930 [Vulcanimicrobiota bacterium]